MRLGLSRKDQREPPGRASLGVHSADGQGADKIHANSSSTCERERKTLAKALTGKHATAGFTNLLANLANINDYALKKSFDQSRQMVNHLHGRDNNNASSSQGGSPGTARIRVASQKASPEKGHMHLLHTGKRRSIPVS